MSVILIAGILISFFAFGAAFVLIRRFDDWRFKFLAGMTALLSAVTAFHSTFKTYVPLSRELTSSGSADDFVAIIMSSLAVLAVVFMERLLQERKEFKERLIREQKENQRLRAALGSEPPDLQTNGQA